MSLKADFIHVVLYCDHPPMTLVLRNLLHHYSVYVPMYSEDLPVLGCTFIILRQWPQYTLARNLIGIILFKENRNKKER